MVYLDRKAFAHVRTLENMCQPKISKKGTWHDHMTHTCHVNSSQHKTSLTQSIPFLGIWTIFWIIRVIHHGFEVIFYDAALSLGVLVGNICITSHFASQITSSRHVFFLHVRNLSHVSNASSPEMCMCFLKIGQLNVIGQPGMRTH